MGSSQEFDESRILGDFPKNDVHPGIREMLMERCAIAALARCIIMNETRANSYKWRVHLKKGKALMKSLPLLLMVVTSSLRAQTQTPVAPVEPSPNNLPIQRIGADDLVAISVYGSPELTRTIRVSQDGFVRLPMLTKRILAKGLMPAELEESIAHALQEGELIVDPYVTVTVAEYHSRPVSVVGAVRSPVTFQALGTVTLLDALARAGGLTPDAGAEILLSRHSMANDGQTATTLVQRIPVKTLIDAADPEVNVKLNGGEEIRV